MNENWKADAIKAVAFAVIAVAIIAAITMAIHWDREARRERPVTITQEDARDPKKIEEQLRVTPIESRVITREIQRSADTPPTVTYYVQAPTMKDAAERTSAAIRANDKALPSAAIAKADRTAVIPNEDRQKVDVYKINLRKDHKIKVGTTWLDHPYLSVGYQAGRFEGTVHFDAQGVHGGTVMYTVWQW